MTMHYTSGCKAGQTGEHTLHTGDVTCGNCKRTRNFRAAMDSRNAISATTSAITEAADAGFFPGFRSTNHVTGENFTITSIDRFGIVVRPEYNERITFPTLTEFLAWITPVDMTQVIEHVTDAGMTWVDAMDLEWSLVAEVQDANAAEEFVNFSTQDHLMERIRNLTHPVVTVATTLDSGDTVYHATCEHGHSTGFHVSADDAEAVARGHGMVAHPLYRAGNRVTSSGDAGTVVTVRGGEAMVKFDNPIGTSGTTIVVPVSTLTPEAVEDMPTPFRTSRKVKNTRQARRYRKGA